MKMDLDTIQFKNRSEINAIINALIKSQDGHREDATVRELIDKLVLMEMCW